MHQLEDGYELIDEFLTADQLQSLIHAVESLHFTDKAGGSRNVEKRCAVVKTIALSPKLLSVAKKYLAGTPYLVRAILFNKTVKNNWLVTWHQDKTVAVSNKFEDPNWGPWSIKEGVVHVQPPLEVLNQMVTFRIHLDDGTEKNGCLKLSPKSQQLGVLNHTAIQEYVKNCEAVICEVKAGSALLMRPHILHASGKSTKAIATAGFTS